MLNLNYFNIFSTLIVGSNFIRYADEVDGKGSSNRSVVLQK